MPKGESNPPDPRGGSARRAEFESLYEQYSREVWALAYARWMDSDLAMDVTQEVFLRLWKQWELNEEIQNPRAWLFSKVAGTRHVASLLLWHRDGTRRVPTTLEGRGSR